MARATNHVQNDRIEAAVIVAALASLGLLVTLAVSTSVSAVSQASLQAEVEPMDRGSETASSLSGIAPSSQPAQPRALR